MSPSLEKREHSRTEKLDSRRREERSVFPLFLFVCFVTFPGEIAVVV